mgnify:CR=1 FL=1
MNIKNARVHDGDITPGTNSYYGEAKTPVREPVERALATSPTSIVARYAGRCKNCRRQFFAGEQIEWSRAGGATCAGGCSSQSERLSGANRGRGGCDGTCEDACYGGCSC